MMLPEFDEAEDWRRTAVERLYRQLDKEVYPDGMEYELTSSYNNWVISNLTSLAQRMEMNDLTNELPEDYLSKLEKMYHYALYVSMPDGLMPALNDSSWVNVNPICSRGYSLFPERKDFLWRYTNGQRGKMPETTSLEFPYCGHYVMRSGWDEDALYLLFDSGLLGFGHDHEDKLHVILSAYGKRLLLDPGNFSYDRSKWRRYITGTHGHNTILVDGLGQNRRRNREENKVWPKPWDKEIPPGNDTVWTTTEKHDFAKGIYAKGYGKDEILDVTHTRRILFVKPGYLVF